MKLSIITCTYNSEKYLQECINSVISQNLNIEDYEHIFVDAYSTDKTKDIVKKYMKKYSNVKLIEHKPQWVYNAMNEGIKEAKWEYILCLNSDDYLVKDTLNIYLWFIKSTGKKDLYYWILNTIVDGVIYQWNSRFFTLKKWLFYNFWTNILIFHPTVLVKRETIIELWMFDEHKKIASDYWMRLKFLKEWKKAVFYPYKVSNFRVHSKSLSCSNDILCDAETNYYKRKYLSHSRFVLSKFIDQILKIYWAFLKILKNKI